MGRPVQGLTAGVSRLSPHRPSRIKAATKRRGETSDRISPEKQVEGGRMIEGRASSETNMNFRKSRIGARTPPFEEGKWPFFFQERFKRKPWISV